MNFTIIQLANCLRRYNLQKIFHTLSNLRTGCALRYNKIILLKVKARNSRSHSLDLEFLVYYSKRYISHRFASDVEFTLVSLYVRVRYTLPITSWFSSTMKSEQTVLQDQPAPFTYLFGLNGCLITVLLLRLQAVPSHRLCCLP